MIAEARSLVDDYFTWLKDRTSLHEIGDVVKLTTPYLDRHNDCLQIYVVKSNGQVVLTDDGETLDDLEQSGFNPESDKRKDLLRVTLNGFGVQLVEGRLEVRASPENFALRKHSLLQAMLAVNDLFYLATPMVASLFYEDVVAWLDLAEVRYSPKVKFAGKSGYDYVFDFLIPKSRLEPERICRAINHPNAEAAKLFILAWSETRDVRPVNAQGVVLLNDTANVIPVGVSDALRNYGVLQVPWSRRDDFRAQLAA